MRRLIVLSTFAALTAATTSVAAGPDEGDTVRALAPIPVAVFAPPNIRDSLVNRVFAEVADIWGPTGIVFDWHRITSAGALHAEHLDVAIEERENGLVAHPDALGWIAFTADTPGSCIHLLQGRAEELISATPNLDRTAFSHEVLVGRALGRALSHELGHYLLQSRAHTPHGLMRAVWPSEQILSYNRRGFELSPQQREAAARYVRQDERTRSGP